MQIKKTSNELQVSHQNQMQKWNCVECGSHIKWEANKVKWIKRLDRKKNQIEQIKWKIICLNSLERTTEMSLSAGRSVGRLEFIYVVLFFFFHFVFYSDQFFRSIDFLEHKVINATTSSVRIDLKWEMIVGGSICS